MPSGSDSHDDRRLTAAYFSLFPALPRNEVAEDPASMALDRAKLTATHTQSKTTSHGYAGWMHVCTTRSYTDQKPRYKENSLDYDATGVIDPFLT
jgi:hypothetical protein